MGWDGMEWNGMEWEGIVRNEMIWNGREWTGWEGMEWNSEGTEWSGLEWNGMEWYGMVWNGAGKSIYYVTLEASRLNLEEVTGHAARGGHAMVHTRDRTGGINNEAFRNFLFRLLRCLI